MILIDTSVWIDYFAGRQSEQVTRADIAVEDRLALTGDLVIAEVLQGLKFDRDVRRVSSAFDRLNCVDLCNRDIAVKAAANYRLLRRRGVTVRGTIDVIVATWCIENHVALLHRDRDFVPMGRELGLIFG